MHHKVAALLTDQAALIDMMMSIATAKEQLVRGNVGIC